MRIILVPIFIALFTSGLYAQNITIKYVQEGTVAATVIHAYATSSDVPPKTWDHYLSADESSQYLNNPSVLDAQLQITAAAQMVVTVPPISIVPVTLKTVVPIPPATAATTVATFQAQQAAIAAGIATLQSQISLLSQLPMATQLSVLSQIQAIVTAALP